MALKHVDIYIENDIPLMKRQDGRFGYLLAYVKTNGDLKTAEGFGSSQFTTQNGIILDAMAEALGRMKEAAEIEFYINSMFITNIFGSGTVGRWRQNGFMNSKNQKVADFPKWERLSGLAERNVVRVIYKQRHEYSLYLQNKLKKLAEGGEK